MNNSRRRWGTVQFLAVVFFLIVWLLGLGALGLTLEAAGWFAVSPTAVAQVTLPPPSPTATATASPTVTATATRTPRPTATPRPTRVVSPTPSPSPSPTPTITPSPTPTHFVPTMPPPFPTFFPSRPTTEPPLPIPTVVTPVLVADGAINIAVLGSDRRPEWSEWHTDAIHIVSIQTERPAVTVISIPRDLYVYIPNFWMSRVNFADFYGDAYGYPGGGTALLRDTLLYNLGIRIDHTVRTDFDGLIGIVDTLGGIDVPVHCRIADRWPYPDENGEYPILTMEPGIVHMDGETALWYARSRMTTSVFSRERRQQQVLRAIYQRGRDLNMLTQIPSLWGQVQEMVVTDLTFDEVVNLARVAFMLPDQNIRFYNIDRSMVTPWTTPQGGSVFLPNWEAIEPMVAEAMAPLPEARMARSFMPVEVWNGTPNADWDRLAADRLMRAGFPVTINPPDRSDYAQTQLFVYSEYAKGTGVGYLQWMFDVPDERALYQPGGSASYGFRLIIGADYQTCFE